MKALLQRVAAASVLVEDELVAEIGKGLLIFLGVEKGDTGSDLDYIEGKIRNARIFDDKNGKMNLSVTDVAGEVLVVSQFTLAADCSRGNRPSFDNAEAPLKAEEIYRAMVKKLIGNGLSVSEGRFGARMKVRLINDGPVTILLESA